jgi:hypothetical protein
LRCTSAAMTVRSRGGNYELNEPFTDSRRSGGSASGVSVSAPIEPAIGGAVLAVANDYFAAVAEPLVIIRIDPSRLRARLVFEAPAPIAGGGPVTSGAPRAPRTSMDRSVWRR